jgi:hypothetical protein
LSGIRTHDHSMQLIKTRALHCAPTVMGVKCPLAYTYKSATFVWSTLAMSGTGLL